MPEDGESKLIMLQRGVEISTEPFIKNEFFSIDYEPTFVIDSGFRNDILSAVPEAIPAFKCRLAKSQVAVGQLLFDEPGKILGHPEPFAAWQAVALMRHLMLQQPNGEEQGLLQANGYHNIFLVKNQKGYVRGVYIYRRKSPKVWHMATEGFPYSRWYPGQCFFTREKSL